MICYLVRHGRDDDSRRGGWSASPLTSVGVAQVCELAERLSACKMNVGLIFTSDLPRARQTADILSHALNLPVRDLPAFRETNNGLLAGMKHTEAERQYPGLYWSALEWEQAYPEGESPGEFFHRIASAWSELKDLLREMGQNAILVTHGGVINVIRCIESNIRYTNKENPFPVGYAQMVEISFE